MLMVRSRGGNDDRRPSRWAEALVQDADVIDMHVDTFIPMRLFRYDPSRRHQPSRFGGYLFGHLDLPRMKEAGLTGAMWSISTNPLRGEEGRRRALAANIARLRSSLASSDEVDEVSSLDGYKAARARGRQAAMPAIQGGNALDADAREGRLPDPAITRVTLVHLTDSRIGGTSSPIGASRHLTDHGAGLIEMLDEARVFVDLAHIHPDGFWEAFVVHNRRLPLLVTHTGVRGVKSHWRNLCDAQLRAVAETGGVVGIMFHRGFLRRPGGPGDSGMVAEHILHAIKVAGRDAVGIGSDYDGFIVPPKDLRSGAGYAPLTQSLADRGLDEEAIRKVLGLNFLRALGEMRPSAPAPRRRLPASRHPRLVGPCLSAG